MDVRIVADPERLADAAAERVRRQLQARPDSVLGLATGRTQRRLYARLVALARAGELDLSRATTFNLDEFLGIDPSHPGSFHRAMREQLFGPLGLDPARTHLPEARPEDPEAAALAYEERIRGAGGIDLQLLGVGANGHVGFNEPTSSLGSRTRVKTLAPSTLAAYARHFEGETMPRVATTVGIATILDAREIWLLASGAEKAAAVAAAAEGPVSARCPASALQWHPRTVVLCDETAASRLSLRAYYDEVARQREALEDPEPPTG